MRVWMPCYAVLCAATGCLSGFPWNPGGSRSGRGGVGGATVPGRWPRGAATPWRRPAGHEAGMQRQVAGRAGHPGRYR